MKPTVIQTFLGCPAWNTVRRTDVCWTPLASAKMPPVADMFTPHYTEKSMTVNSHLAANYGILLPGWEEAIRAGLSECFRVLKPTNPTGYTT
jgi:hypothetical protein